jgi:hypothetical protein
MSTSVDLQEIDTTPVSSTCNHITQFQTDIDIESSKIDQLLCYYHDVKTKRQLNLEVPAGFRWRTQWQTDAAYHDSLEHSTIQHCSDNVPDVSSITDLPSTILESTLPDFDPTNDVLQTPVSGHIPIVCSVDKPSTSLPNTITMNEDFLRASLGFRRIDTFKQHLPVLYQNNIRLDHTPADAVMDNSDLANTRKTKRNTSPVPRPSSFGDTIHMDIVFGPEVAIGNVHYGLLFTDCFSRMNYIYPLQNLTSDIPRQMNAFFTHIDMYPKRLISDFDLKLIGGKARDHLNSLLIHVNAAPAMR